MTHRSRVFDLDLGSPFSCHNLAGLDNAPLSSYAGRVMCIWKVCTRETVPSADVHMLVIDKFCARG